jgi:hypothetical protein
MIDSCAAARLEPTLEPYGLGVTAWVDTLSLPEHEAWLRRMRAAVVELGPDKLLVTACTPELLKPRKHFPKNVAPRNLFLSEVHDKLIDVPMLIGLVLGHGASIAVNKEVCLGALVPLALVTRVEGTAVDTTVQHVVLLLEQVLQLLHEQLRGQLVLLVHQLVQVVEGNLPGQSLDEAGVHAVHVDGQQDDLGQVLAHVDEGLLDQPRHLEEVTRDEDAHRVFYLNLGLFAMDIPHEPIENIDVAMNTNVNVIKGF